MTTDGRARAAGLAARVGAMAAALLLTLSGVALAHGHLRSSAPAAGAHLNVVPRTLRLVFNEAAELQFTTARLVSADGREVELGAASHAAGSRTAVTWPVTGHVNAGTYTVQWQMAGADGHPVRGSFRFVVAPGALGADVPVAATAPDSVANAGANVVAAPASHHDPTMMPQGDAFGAESAGYVVLRWLQFVGLLLAIGAVAFHHLVLGRLRRAGVGDIGPMLAEADRSAAAMGVWAVAALVVTLVARLVAQSWAMHGARAALDAGAALGMVRRTTWGLGWLTQLAGVAIAGVALRGARRSHRAARWWGVALVGIALLALVPALSGHAASAPRLRPLAITSDWLHVLGASSWLGTLAVLLFAGLRAARGDGDARTDRLRVLVDAFSPVALISAALAAATGTLAGWIHVGTLPNLWGTRYGVTLLVKLAVLAIVAFTGFYNWRVVRPALARGDGDPRFRRSATTEVVVALVVLLVTAVLVASPTSMDVAP